MDDLNKKAVMMLLQGATLVAEPCPYCKGVRVMKNGNALCTNCGRAPDPEKTKQNPPSESVLERLEKKLNDLTTELENADSKNRKEIIESIDALASTISKMRK